MGINKRQSSNDGLTKGFTVTEEKQTITYTCLEDERDKYFQIEVNASINFSDDAVREDIMALIVKDYYRMQDGWNFTFSAPRFMVVKDDVYLFGFRADCVVEGLFDFEIIELEE